MKNNILLICLAVVLFSCEKQDQLQNAGQILNKIKAEAAPDKREAIFDVSFAKSRDGIIVRGETDLPQAKAALLSELSKNEYVVTDSLVVLPDEKSDSLNWGLVTISVCNLRSLPSHDAELASQALLGTPVRVFKKQSNWYLVQTPDKYISWVDSAALFLLSKQRFDNWRKQAKMIYLPSFGLATEPNSGKPVTDLVAGCILQFMEKSGKDCLLSMPDRRLLQVPLADVEDFEIWKKRAVPSVSEISKTAELFMGRPYLWGGTSAKGADCSGFTKMVYFLNGIILARDASLQFRHGEKITEEQGWKDLQEGDLVFFGRKATNEKPARATHVGYYLGNSEFIHASGFVRVNSFDSAKENFYNRKIDFLGGRRIINSLGSDGIVKVSDHPWY
ncbi:MAG: hypothetical protein A2W90_04115 [Bacteroidetes bacterium GWF2_42_66]|nr:MAG: hypothetical protein A2W92_06930 [Bacteroidetes bacterium GWA2_42_15]OFY02493.1 MAG: hypothetical protein A2W89_21740 [Bacteroidetes bacterium GWE2_42_39]OFY41409.1 MAG: hypothetical protein A2W90_04115 [Bacteroidetes bacterium GWF2_42_66]HBL75387.1 glycoside hydrolase [Prolixibacteraceae bacterium]HCR90307.1 glycoside hydrolase [Prolixibacteraceae bacterium]